MSPATKWPGVEDIPIEQPPRGPLQKKELPDDDDMGFNDPDNILFVNMQGSGLGERFRDRIEELDQMLRLTHQLAVIHCGIQVNRRKKEGLLPGDDSDDSRWKRSQYRARVVDTYFNDGVYPWIYSPQSSVIQKGIHVEKSRFHWELLATMLSGLVLPRPLSASLEAIFQSISGTINETKYTPDARSFWAVSQVYTYDEVRDDIRASLRNISYTLDEEMDTVCKRKNTMTTVRANLGLRLTDFTLNERSWKIMQPEVEKFIVDSGIGNIRDPPDVPV